VLRSPISRSLISVATAFIAGMLLIPAAASAADHAPTTRTQFKRECERRGGTFAEGKNSEGKTVWVCVKDGNVIADCVLGAGGYGGCSVPKDWPLAIDGSSPAGSGSRPQRTGPSQYLDEGAYFPSSSAGGGTGLHDVGPGQGLGGGTFRAPASP